MPCHWYPTGIVAVVEKNMAILTFREDVIVSNFQVSNAYTTTCKFHSSINFYTPIVKMCTLQVYKLL